MLAKAAPVRALNGAVELVVMVFHDLTEIRRTEKMRKDFVANVSHEFKTPLTSIRGYAETLINIEPGEDPGITREFLEAIDRNSILLQALVDDLLVLASLESEQPVSKERFNIKELIEQQIQSKRHLLSANNLRMDLDCPPIEIEADARGWCERCPISSTMPFTIIGLAEQSGISVSLAGRQLRDRYGRTPAPASLRQILCGSSSASIA